MIFFDELKTFIPQYNRTSMIKDNHTNAEVDGAYFSTETTNRTFTMLSSTAIRFPQKTIDTIGIISVRDHPEFCILHESNSYGSCTADQVFQRENCRMYRSLVTFYCL